jgi:hypothetical protein
MPRRRLVYVLYYNFNMVLNPAVSSPRSIISKVIAMASSTMLARRLPALVPEMPDLSGGVLVLSASRF